MDAALTAAAPTPPQIFAWEIRRQRWWQGALPGLLLASLCGHCASFYLLQVLTSAPATLPPTPVQITLPSPGSPDGAALARWLAVADPALAVIAPRSRPAAADFAGLPALAYTPSALLGERTQLFALPRERFADSPGTPGGGSPYPRLPAAAPRPLALAARTQVALAEPLRRRLAPGSALPPPALAGLSGAAQPAQPLQPAVFLLGVLPAGGPPLIFQRKSSGRAAADEAARNSLAQLPFAPAPAAGAESIVWGEAQVGWGQDAYR